MRNTLLALLLLVGTASQGVPLHSVVMTWTSVPGSTYNLYRSDTPGGPVGSYGSRARNLKTTTFTDTAVKTGHTYYWLVTAYCASCNPHESPYSNKIQATIP